MRTNKFSIGGLIGLHVSSVVFEVIRTISSLFIIFVVVCEKILSPQKRKSNQSQLTKQTQENKKQQKQHVFARTKTSKRVKVVCFVFWCFFLLLKYYFLTLTEGTRKIFPGEFPCQISLVNPPQFFSNCKYYKAGA